MATVFKDLNKSISSSPKSLAVVFVFSSFIAEIFFKIYLEWGRFDDQGNFPRGSMFLPSGSSDWFAFGMAIGIFAGKINSSREFYFKIFLYSVCTSFLCICFTPYLGFVFIDPYVPLTNTIIGSAILIFAIFVFRWLYNGGREEVVDC